MNTQHLDSHVSSLRQKTLPPLGAKVVRMPFKPCSANARPILLHLQHKIAFTGRSHFARLRSLRSIGMAAEAVHAPPQLGQPNTLEDLKITSTFIDELPGDKEEKNFLRQVHDAFYSKVNPTQTGTEPYLVAGSEDMAAEIGLDPSELQRPEFAMIFSGNSQHPGSVGRTWAQCYGGHQFGQWAGQLGDGRAMSLGEVTGPSGKRYELQLKGAGKTPYSRMADGRAVMRSSIREFVASEAMYHLGVPTTRALSLVGTGDNVLRDMFYKVSSSFVRFGTFQLPASRGGLESEMVKLLADFIIKHHYKHLEGREDKYAAFLGEVAQRTGKLVAKWQNLGFVHGVLNTDNMSILGETIDYGPYGFLEVFDPSYTPNTTDEPGHRYAFKQQPEVGQWNLAQLANALLIGGLLEEKEAVAALGEYPVALTATYEAGVAAKLGLKAYDRELAVGLLTAMYEDSADFTNTFRALSDVSTSDAPDSIPPSLRQALPGELSAERKEAWGTWLSKYRSELLKGLNEDERKRLQDSVNPCYIPRNHLLQEVIAEAEKGNYSPVQDFLELLKNPFEEKAGSGRWRQTSGGQIRRGIEMLSCSS